MSDASVSIEPSSELACTIRVTYGASSLVIDARPIGTAPQSYRQGRRFAWSYRHQGDLDLARVDTVCAHLARHEDALAAALAGSTPPASPSATTARDERLDVAGAPFDLYSVPRLSERIRHLPMLRATLEHHTPREFELALALETDAIAVRVRRIASGRNPYLAGRSIEVLITDRSACDGVAATAALARAIIDCETELLAALRRTRDPGTEDADPAMFPVGRLTPFPAGDDHPVAGIVFLTSPCYANCIFCGEASTRNYAIADHASLIASIRSRSFAPTLAVIAGYEPLSHPGVAAIIEACRDTGVAQIELMTTGIPLEDSYVADALVAAGLTSVAVPLYSHHADTNDRIMRRSGAFRATVRGLERLRRGGVQIHVHSLVLRQNLADIDALDSFARDSFGASFVAAPARRKINYELVAVTHAELASSVRRARLLGVPFCLIPRMKDDPDVVMTRPLHRTLKPMSEVMRTYLSQGLVQTADCSACVYRHACLGVQREQLTLEPSLRLVPWSAA